MRRRGKNASFRPSDITIRLINDRSYFVREEGTDWIFAGKMLQNVNTL